MIERLAFITLAAALLAPAAPLAQARRSTTTAVPAAMRTEAAKVTCPQVLGQGLQTGRIRGVYGPEGEQAALALYRRLPLGRELTESTRELNEALQALEGRTIERVAVTALGPGEYGVTLSTEDYELVLRLGRAGARLATIGA